MNLRSLQNEARRIVYFLKTGYYSHGERVNPDLPDTNFENHFKVYKFVRQFAEGKDVLDVGCGTGYGTAHLAERARNVIGIDISPAAIRFARRKYPTLDYRRMDAMKLEFPPQSFDFIVSTENFEHLPDQHEHTRQLARVLRPDGLCFIATPNPEATAGKNRFHTHEFTFAELRDLLSKFFAEVSILENSFTLPENRVAKDQRFAAGDKGLLSLPSCDTTYLSNTHSFFALAKRPIAS